MIKLSFFTRPLVLIFLLALFLRLFQLNNFPVGFHNDEVKAGWNAYSILKTGLDDRGNKLALYYNSFGDYRPTGIFYTIIPSLALFGKSEFAVRLPSALFGALTILVLYFLTRELTNKKRVAIIASLLLAINPWHISVSRATSEVVISMFLALLGIYLLIRFLNTITRKFLIWGVFFLILSYFFYHSIRLLAPLFIGMVVFYYWRSLGIKIKKVAVGVLIAVSLTTLFFSLDSQARSRFSQVSIFNDLDVHYELSKMPFEEGPNKVFIARLFHNKLSVYARRFINEYTRYFSADFLIGSTGKPLRYLTVGVGQLTYIEALLLLIGLAAIVRGKQNFLPLLLLLVAPIPAALTTEDAPNLHRALFMIPFIAIIGAYGLEFIFNLKRFKKPTLYLTSFLLVANFIFYLHQYYTHAKFNVSLYRNIGAKELAQELNKVQNNYDKIVLTDIPDDPYPWIAFFTGRDPATFNRDAIKREKGVWTTENFEFTGQRCPSKDVLAAPESPKMLVVDGEGCDYELNLRRMVKILNQIKRPDSGIVYTLWSTI